MPLAATIQTFLTDTLGPFGPVSQKRQQEQETGQIRQLSGTAGQEAAQ
jgi:hypothetical protein